MESTEDEGRHGTSHSINASQLTSGSLTDSQTVQHQSHLSPQQTSNSEASDESRYNRESERLNSFTDWPIETCMVRPEDLARSGFYYIGPLDRVQCFSCDGSIRGWTFGDDADEQHRMHYPHCKMVHGQEPRNVAIDTGDTPPNSLPSSSVDVEQPDSNGAMTSSTVSSTSDEDSSDDEVVPIIQPINITAETVNMTRSHIVNASFNPGSVEYSVRRSPPRSGITRKKAKLDSSKINRNLMKVLKEQAGIACEDHQIPHGLERPVDILPLEIRSELGEQGLLDVDGHFDRREDFLNTYNPPSGDVDLANLFILAKRQAEREARESYQQNAAQRDRYVQINGNIVGVIGQAGIGKTTVSKLFGKKILQKAFTNDQDLLSMDYIFYMPLRDVDYEGKSRFLDFLVSGSSCDWKHNRSKDEAIVEHLKDNPKVILIMDGLDEAYMPSISQTSPSANLYGKATAETFIKNILSGKLLPRAKKFITSRPRQFYDMNFKYRPKFIASVLGLNELAQAELCLNMFGDFSSRVLEYLADHPDISAYCYVPINCILTMHCIHASLKNSGSLSLTSITRVMVYAFDGFVKSDSLRGEQFEPEKLAHLAWYGFSNQKYIFNEHDLTTIGIFGNTRGAFLDVSVSKHSNKRLTIIEGDKRSYFSHFIWQEFFSAIELILFMSLEKFRENIPHFHSSRWEVVTKFMFGLCDQDCYDALLRIFLHSVNSDNQSTITQKKEILKNFLLRSIPAVMENDSTPAFLRVCNWTREARIFSLVETEMESSLHTCVKLRGSILPSDIAGLHYLLRNSRKIRELELGFGINMITFVGDSFTRFFKEMVETLSQRPELKLRRIMIINSLLSDQGIADMCKCLGDVEDIWLYKSNASVAQFETLSRVLHHLPKPLKHLNAMFEDSEERGIIALSSCLHKIEVFDLWMSDISEMGYRILSRSISELENPMKTLNLRGCSIDEQRADALSTCLHNVENLNLEGCEMTGCGIEHLSSAISRHSRSMELVRLNKNVIGDRGAIALSTCVHNIATLCLVGCDIHEVGLREIARGIERRSEPMKSVDFSAIKFGDTGAISVSSCLHNIEELILINCGITETSATLLASEIKNRDLPMKRLDISFNLIGYEGTVALSSCLFNIECLDATHCDLSVSGLEEFTTTITHLQKPMKRLNLDHNQFGDPGAAIISPSLMNVERLIISRCCVSSQGVASMCDAVRSQTNKVKELNLRGNKIGDDGAAVISDCLYKMESLSLSYCDVTTAGIEQLSHAIKQLDCPMKQLDLSENKIDDRAAIAISTCLSNIENLNIRFCRIAGDGLDAMADAIKRLPEECNSQVSGLYSL